MLQSLEYTVSHEPRGVFVAPYLGDHTAARIAQDISEDRSSPYTESVSRDFTEDEGATTFIVRDNDKFKSLQVACKIAVTLASRLEPAGTVRIK